jgi:pseudouridylate synthase
MPTVFIHPEVAAALRHGAPVVALESALVTTGPPREPFEPQGLDAPGWDSRRPVNLETALLLQRLVRAVGAVPAMVAVIGGALQLGLDDDDLSTLADDRSAGKVSITSLAHALASGRSAGTTVSATLHACIMPPSVDDRLGPIRVVATGGIGGVHRHWTQTPDISADLKMIASTPACVVCAGAKSILDLPATLELLQTLGVPVVGLGTGCFPLFHARGSRALPLHQTVATAAEAASICRAQWQTLGRSEGVVLANPISEDAAMDPVELERAVAAAEDRAAKAEVVGDDRTPFLLEEMRRLTDGRSLLANIALLAANARMAASVALELRT